MAVGGGAEHLAELVAGARNIVAFTGAGVSTECGIPDFRSKNSAWHRHPPMPFDVFLASEENQIVSWTRKFAMDDLHGDARPGRCHKALAALMREDKVSAIITQNIDGLHQLAGTPRDRVIELHGSGRHAVCLGCGVRLELPAIREKFEATGKAPRCLCGGVVKTATISFGQRMPRGELRRAEEATLACDLFLALGSSLVVWPAAGFPALAKENGAKLAIVNNDPTQLDNLADLVLREDIGAVMERFGAGAT